MMSAQEAVALGSRLGAERVEAERREHGVSFARARLEPGYVGLGWGETARNEGVDREYGVPAKHRMAFFRAYGKAAREAMLALEAPPFTFAIIAHTGSGRIVWRGIRSRDDAEKRRVGELRRYKVCEVVPEALADILGLMYDDDPDVGWGADLLDRIAARLIDNGLGPSGSSRPWLTRHAQAWAAAAALDKIVNVLFPPDDPDVQWSSDAWQDIQQALVRHGFVPRPQTQQRARARR